MLANGWQLSFNYIDDGSSLVYGRITTDAKDIYMYESFFSKEAVIYVENLRHLVLPNCLGRLQRAFDFNDHAKYYYYTCWLIIVQVLLQTSFQMSLETVNVHLLLSTFHHPPLAISAVVCHPSSTIYSLPRLTSTVYQPRSAIQRLPSTLYQPPSTI